MKSQEPAEALLNAPVVQIRENMFSCSAEQETLLPTTSLFFPPSTLSRTSCAVFLRASCFAFCCSPTAAAPGPHSCWLAVVGMQVASLQGSLPGPSPAHLPPAQHQPPASRGAHFLAQLEPNTNSVLLSASFSKFTSTST